MEKVDYNRTYAVLFSIQFGKGIPGCGNLNLFNRLFAVVFPFVSTPRNTRPELD